MSQFNAPVRRSSGDLDVYTGLLVVAFLVLVAGVALVAMANMEHSSIDNQPGGILKAVERR